jgi:Mn-dependent DtxR family transcriptional regulator
MRLQESGEMYLETIYILSKTMDTVRSIDVVEHMGYSKPSVSRAVGLLKNGGYLTVEDNGGLHLTEAGRQIGEKIYARHTTLTHLLIRLGVDPETASTDACRMEHAISDATFEALQKHAQQYLGKTSED